MKNPEVLPGGTWVTCAYITKNGKRIYPKAAKFFRFYVPPNKVKDPK